MNEKFTRQQICMLMASSNIISFKWIIMMLTLTFIHHRKCVNLQILKEEIDINSHHQMMK